MGMRSDGMEQVSGKKSLAWWERYQGKEAIDNRGDSDSVGTINLVSLRGFGGS